MFLQPSSACLSMPQPMRGTPELTPDTTLYHYKAYVTPKRRTPQPRRCRSSRATTEMVETGRSYSSGQAVSTNTSTRATPITLRSSTNSSSTTLAHRQYGCNTTFNSPAPEWSSGLSTIRRDGCQQQQAPGWDPHRRSPIPRVPRNSSARNFQPIRCEVPARVYIGRPCISDARTW